MPNPHTFTGDPNLLCELEKTPSQTKAPHKHGTITCAYIWLTAIDNNYVHNSFFIFSASKSPTTAEK